MHSLLRLERYLESLLEGGFLRLFHSRLQPADLAKRLVRAMEEQQTLSVGRTLVPNEYVLRLSPDDAQACEPIRHTLERELAAYLQGRAARHGWEFVAPPRVTIEHDQTLQPGTVEVQARLIEHEDTAGQAGAVAQAPEPDVAPTRPLPVAPLAGGAADAPARVAGASLTLVLSGPDESHRLALAPGRALYVGRGLENDVILAHPSVSRRHARLVRAGQAILVEDLGSANGTRHNGRAVSQARLRAGDEVAFGAVVLRVAISVEAAHTAGAADPSRRRRDKPDSV
jgi:hypothetical protein